MSFIKKNLYILVLLAFIIFPAVSFAQPVCTNGEVATCTNGETSLPCSDNSTPTCVSISSSVNIINPISATTINGFIKDLLEGVIKIGLPIVALAIIYSGFLFVAARGNSEKLKTAKSALLYSIIGAALLLGAWAIAQLIANTVLSL